LFPVFLDLCHLQAKLGWIKHLRRLLLCFNAAMIVIAALVMINLVLFDDGISFCVKDTVPFLRNRFILKEHIILPLFLDVLVPIVLYYGVPCQQTERRRRQCKDHFSSAGA